MSRCGHGGTSQFAGQRTCLCVARAETAPSARASAALDGSPRFSERFGLLEPASVPPRALDMPMNCSFSDVESGEFLFACSRVVDFSPGSDSLSLHIYLGDLDLCCIFDLLVHLGTFLSWRMLSLRRHLEDFGLRHLHWVHGWLDTCVRNLFTGSLLDPVLRFSPTVVGTACPQLAA